MVLKTFNEIRDEQHKIARKRDGMVKVGLQTTYNNRKKHTFLYGYIQSEKDYVSHRLVGKKEDVILISETFQQEQSGPVLTRKLTPQKNRKEK